MNEEQKVKKQLLKNTILNLITFTIIFYILGMIVYSQFRNSLYMSSDLELNNFVSQEENGFVQKDNGMANDTARLDNIRPEKEETPILLLSTYDATAAVVGSFVLVLPELIEVSTSL